MEKKSKNSNAAPEDYFKGGGEMGERMRGFDWAKTPLGQPETWSRSLKTSVDICLNSLFPMVIWWGRELVLLFNDNWRPLIGDKAESALGKPGGEVFPEVWDVIGPMFGQVLNTGQATWSDDELLLLKRHGFIEEAYFTWSYSPIRDDDGRVGGIFTAVTETTQKVVGERRLQTLRDLGMRSLAGAGSVEEACRAVCEVLTENSFDIPFALLYLLDEDGKTARLVEAVRLDKNTKPAPAEIEIGANGDVWNFNRSLESKKSGTIENTAEKFGDLTAGAWTDDATKKAFVVPLAKAGIQDAPAGFLVAGISPRLNFDKEYRGFLELVSGHIGTAIGIVRDIAERKQAEERLRESERRFKAVFNHQFQFMAILAPDGTVTEINETSLTVTRTTREAIVGHLFWKIVWFAGLPDMQAALRNGIEAVSKGASENIEGEADYFFPSGELRRAAFAISALRDAGGETINIFVEARDITEEKQAEEALRQSQAETERQRRLYDTILSNTPDLAYVFDLNHRFTYANEVLLEMWGKTWDEAIGKNCLELGYEPWHAEMHDREIEQVIAAKQPIRGEVPFIGALGRRIYDYIFVPVIGESGEVEAIIGTTRDITERKQAEEALRESEERYRVLFASAPMAVFVCDRNAVIQHYNSRAAELWGREPVRGIEQHCGSLKLWLPDGTLLPHIQSPMMEVLHTGIPAHNVEVFIERPDGSRLPVLVNFAALKNAQGEITGAITSFMDITERKRTEMNFAFLAEISQDLARLTTADEIMQAVGAKIGAHLNLSRCAFVEINEAADEAVVNHEWLRKDAPSLVGVYRIEDFVTDEFQRAARAEEIIVIRDPVADPHVADAEKLAALEIGSFIAAPLIRDGEWRFLLAIYDEQPRDWRTDEIELMRELTTRVWTRLERARAEDEREKMLEREQIARKQAEQANRLKDEFLATVSHELRTPLNAILGWSSMLQSGKANEEMRSRADETIYRSAKSQAQLIEDLLDVSRIITGKMNFTPQPVQLAFVVKSAIDTLRPAIDAKSIRLETDIDCEPCMIGGDAQRLQQIVWNLISNAVKFTPEGGTIEVFLENDNLHARLTIKDSGKGIEAEFLPYIFERFRQEDASSTRRHGGLGLGLAIVRQLVELHGGAISATSAGAGQGSTFTLELPLNSANEERKDGDSKNGREILSDGFSGENNAPKQLSGVSVLLVDDELDTLEMLDTALSDAGAEVRAASSSADAFEILQDWQPDALVSDIAMPIEDGYSLIKKVRALAPENGGLIPAIAMTAYVRVEDRMRVLASGFQMYVPKPAEPAELITAIGNLIDKDHSSSGD